METLIVTLTISTVVSLLSLLVGGVIGWTARTYTMEKTQYSQYPSHPEMYDENGNIVPDEILAVRFEQHDSTDEEEDDD